eukprot:1538516-Rhodomonas_salina.2
MSGTNGAHRGVPGALGALWRKVVAPLASYARAMRCPASGFVEARQASQTWLGRWARGPRVGRESQLGASSACFLHACDATSETDPRTSDATCGTDVRASCGQQALDHNKLLTLANGDRLPVTNGMKIVLETDNLVRILPVSVLSMPEAEIGCNGFRRTQPRPQSPA